MEFLAAFAAKFLSIVAVPVLDWIYSKIETAVELAEDRKRIAQANKAIKEKLLAAKSSEEKDAAIRDLINRL